MVDLGILSLKKSTISATFYPSPSSTIPRLPPSHPAIIEWRAMTVVELFVVPTPTYRLAPADMTFLGIASRI